MTKPMLESAKRYTVSDGRMVLTLRAAGGGWYAVTSPLDPGITAQARTVEQAFEMACDAQRMLRASRAGLSRPSAS